MARRIGDLVRRLANVAGGFFDAFLRDNRVIPPVLALLALFVFFLIATGSFLGGAGEDGGAGSPGRASGEIDLAQAQGSAGDDPLAPEVQNRDVDSYAAYQTKDPFRQLVAPAPEEKTTSDEDGTGSATGEETTVAPGGTGSGSTTSPSTAPPAGGGNGGGNGGASSSRDADADGLSDRRERALGQDPANPDTDLDGILDGDDDSDRDGRPDGRPDGGGGGGAGGSGNGGGGAGGGPGGGGGYGGGGGSARPGAPGLPDSGGGVYP